MARTAIRNNVKALLEQKLALIQQGKSVPTGPIDIEANPNTGSVNWFQISKDLGTSPAIVYNWEKNRITAFHTNAMMTWGNVVGCELDQLLQFVHDDDEPPVPTYRPVPGKRIGVKNYIPELLEMKWRQTYGPDEPVNMSQLARDTGITYSTVFNWYKGRVLMYADNLLCTFGDYLEVELHELLRYEYA